MSRGNRQRWRTVPNVGHKATNNHHNWGNISIGLWSYTSHSTYFALPLSNISALNRIIFLAELDSFVASFAATFKSDAAQDYTCATDNRNLYSIEVSVGPASASFVSYLTDSFPVASLGFSARSTLCWASEKNLSTFVLSTTKAIIVLP